MTSQRKLLSVGEIHKEFPRVWKLILFCIVLYTAAMEGVRWMAHGIVGSFGVIGGLSAIGAMYGAAVLYERRRKKVEIPPPL
jgi:hypothetical protein